MKRLLLVTHRPIDQAGGPSARWRAMARYLPEHGWKVDVVSAPAGFGGDEFASASARSVAARAAVMGQAGRLAEPLFARAGLRPNALPLSMLWIPRGAAQVHARARAMLADVTLATGPPLAGPLAARLGTPRGCPLVVELRDLWAGNPMFDAGGPVLPRVERWMLERAERIVVCTPEAADDVRVRHRDLARRVVTIANGFDPAIHESSGVRKARGVLEILHSGSLTPARPLTPLLEVLGRSSFAGRCRLVLQGFLSPRTRVELAQYPAVEVEVLAPAPWEGAVNRISQTDVGLVTQASGAGDATAVASKVYEYLALGKPVLCLTDGGATEALLRRLGCDELCARLDDTEGIEAAVARALAGGLAVPSPERVAAYDRRHLAGELAELLNGLVARR